MTEKELDRNAARRLAIIKHAEEVTGNDAMAPLVAGTEVPWPQLFPWAGAAVRLQRPAAVAVSRASMR